MMHQSGKSELSIALIVVCQNGVGEKISGLVTITNFHGVKKIFFRLQDQHINTYLMLVCFMSDILISFSIFLVYQFLFDNKIYTNTKWNI